jgi:hypothetical protein
MEYCSVGSVIDLIRISKKTLNEVNFFIAANNFINQ